MLKRRWDKFMCPNGIRRTFNPKKWEHGTSVLVFWEMVAVCSAVAAIRDTTHGQWFLYAAAIIGAGALAWYAQDKSSLGEMPLTGVSANRIANVVHMVNTEEKLGRVVIWTTITADSSIAFRRYPRRMNSGPPRASVLRNWLVVLFAAVLLAAGCGKGDAESSVTTVGGLGSALAETAEVSSYRVSLSAAQTISLPFGAAETTEIDEQEPTIVGEVSPDRQHFVMDLGALLAPVVGDELDLELEMWIDDERLVIDTRGFQELLDWESRSPTRAVRARDLLRRPV